MRNIQHRTAFQSKIQYCYNKISSGYCFSNVKDLTGYLAMKPIKVLIVEQNILARQAIAGTLRKHAHFKVTGVFGNSGQVEKKVRDSNPDVILLDIESADGLEILKALKADFPQCPVVVLSRRTPEGAKLAIAALEAGALDFVTKPKLGQNLLFASRHFTKRLIPIVQLSARLQHKDSDAQLTTDSITQDSENVSVSEKKLRARKPRVMVIGACTGGPAALSKLIAALPEDFDIPVVVVQHFPKYYTAELAEVLDRRSKLKVREADEGARLKPGTVWIAPGGFHCEISGWSCKPFLKVHKGPRELGVRPSINNLFRSAANVFERDVMAVLLSGHGEDGFEGIKDVKRAGGLVIAQHPDSALVPDLPLMALNSGLADYKYIPEKMADRLKEIYDVDSSFRGSRAKNVYTDSGDISSEVSLGNLTNF
jgi:two-component system chemotaxis response regulator CheB